MHDDCARPVLVTGSHRSGSTFVGKMLSLSPALGYIREPLSVIHRPGILNVRFPYWFPYVCAENETLYLRPVQDMLAFNYQTAAAVRSVRAARDAAAIVHDRWEFARYRRRHARPLLKDPIAVLSAGWLSDTFDTQVIVLIRHPAAFASSLMKYAWTHPFDHFLKQPLLMRDLLSPFQEEIQAYAEKEHAIIDQAILLWNVIHHAILQYRGARSDWRFFRHEDVARDPVDRFGEMFEYLGIGFGERQRDGILDATHAANPSEPRDAGALKRDSRSAAETWKTRLSREQIEHIRIRTEPVAVNFYSDADW
jgi:hypothetical protein